MPALAGQQSPEIWFGSEAKFLTPDISPDIPVNFYWGDAGFHQTNWQDAVKKLEFLNILAFLNLCKMFIFLFQRMSRHDNC